MCCQYHQCLRQMQAVPESAAADQTAGGRWSAAFWRCWLCLKYILAHSLLHTAQYTLLHTSMCHYSSTDIVNSIAVLSQDFTLPVIQAVPFNSHRLDLYYLLL